MALITCKDVSFAYEGKLVVTGLDFVVNEGDYLCVAGENGSGKSTLLKGLLGLVKPLHGEIRRGDGLKATEIGYLPQQTPVQRDFPASVYEVVLSGRLSKGGISPFYSKGDRLAAEKYMEKLGISELKNKCYRELSGGQQQRVLLARALCATGRALLLDEPAAGLDPVITRELYALIASLNCQHNITIIMVSHDIKGAINSASHVLHIRNSQEFFGTTEEYRGTDAGREFLGGGSHA